MPAPRPTVLISCSFLLAALATSDVGAQPANDSCTNPEVVTSLPFVGSTAGLGTTATAIPGCPPFADFWTAYVASEIADIVIGPATELVSAYVIPGGTIGECPQESDRVLCSANGGVVPVTPGDLLLVQREATNPWENGLRLQEVPDRCVTAIEVDTLPFTHKVILNVLGAEPGYSGCPATQDAWYVFHPQVSETIAVGVRRGVPMTGAISVFETLTDTPGVCPSPLDLIECDTDLVLIPVVAGRHYWFRNSSDDTAGRPSLIQVDRIDPLPNDECVDAIPLPFGVPVYPELLVATESTTGSCGGFPDAWFTFEATNTGPLRIDGRDFSRISVYTEGPSCPGTVIACDIATATFDAFAGETYIVRYSSIQPEALMELLVSSAATTGTDDRFRYSTPSRSVTEGAAFELPIYLTSETGTFGDALPLSGLSLGICVDPSEVEIIDFELGSSLVVANGGSPPDFWNFDQADGGIIAGVVISVFGLAFLPPDATFELFRMTAFPLAPAGGTLDIEFCEEIPPLVPVDLVVVSSDGIGRIPDIENGTFTVIAGPEFRRGDANLDAVIDIADALAILDVLFDPAPGAFPCALAADVNDDEIVDIADPIALLDHLFAPVSPPIPPPVCGEDPTAGSLGCAQPTSCP